MVGGDRGRDVLQQHGLAGLGRRDDQAALALADRRHQVDGTGGQILGAAIAALKFQPLGRVKRRQVLEQHLVARAVGRIVVDLADLEQRKVALAFLRRADQPGNRIAGAQVETPDLARGHVDVIRPGQIEAVGRAQEAKAVLQDLEHAVAIDVLTIARVRLEDREDDVLLARAREVLQTHRLGHLHEFVNRLGLQLGQIHRAARERQIGRTDDLGVVLADRLPPPPHPPPPPPSAHDRPRGHVADPGGPGPVPYCFAADYGPDFPDSLSQVLIQKGGELGFGQGADLLRLDRAVLEQDQRWNATNAEFGRRVRILVVVELRDPQPILVLGCDLIEDRRDHLAGAAPFRPEIQQYRLFGLKDVLIEAGIRGVHNVLVTHAVEPPLRGENLYLRTKDEFTRWVWNK